ncbi:MAG: hypothetical protein A3I61_09190 [Acidobacteria bacterium RIFCSPLOWO2_02_FULL_68_18]|nr:MAG: hypothetical protein A3I61_09190 [Acidobacteria bacterium RIFCSPLOWO2_02_FULL_68_18]
MRAEHKRASRAAAAASAKLQALAEKFHADRERAAAEHTTHKMVLGLLRHYLLRLERMEAEVAERVALEERVKRAQLAISVKAARRQGVAPAAAANAARLATLSREYEMAVSRWRSGELPGDLQHLTRAGLRWTVPAGAAHEPSSNLHKTEVWLPLRDLAAIRAFVVGGVMLDIGAGVGATAIPRILLGDCARAYAAEPDGSSYLCLVGNMLQNHLEGRVLPDRVAISGSSDTVNVRHVGVVESEDLPLLTLDAWVERLGIPIDDVRFVRIAMQAWNLSVLRGAANLLKRAHIIWQIEIPPPLLGAAGAGLEDLSGDIATHLTHVRELDRFWTDPWRPASEAGAILRARSKERGGINLLLFNLPGAYVRTRAVSEAAANRRSRPLISLLHSTARLPGGWKPAMEAHLAKASDPKSVEYILAVNEDEDFELPSDMTRGWEWCTLVKDGVTGPNSGWNAAAKASHGDILITISDDFFPPAGWDGQIRDAIPDFTQEVVLDVDNSDGSRRLLPFSILTRRYYDRYGYIFYPGYHGLMGDYEFTEQARRDRVVRPVRHIVFEHRHPSRGTAPMDDIYARQRSHYEEGRRLYKERKAKGFPKWPD